MAHSNIPAIEMQALQDLYDATNGETWLWRNASGLPGIQWDFTSSSNNPCTDNWQGITCNFIPPYYVEQLILSEYNMSGTVPSSISGLSHLTILELSTNQLYGRLPTSLEALTGLVGLALDHNQFSGTIPSPLGSLYQLQSLSLDNNLLHGKIPASMGNLTALTDLFLDFNSLTGALPSSLGQLGNLRNMYVYNNMLTGRIPPSFGNLTRLIELHLYNNSLSGPIPLTLGHLVNLRSFGAFSNQLTGTIPPELGNWRLVVYVALYENSLHGTIPATLSQMQSLNTLLLYDNYLTGTLSANLSLLSKMNDLQVNDNLLEGTVPRSFSAFTKLTVLRLFNNFLSGSLEGVFDPDNQTQLTSVQVNDNQFTGALPDAVFLLPMLDTFATTSNCFDGTLPDTLCSATSLVNLVADGLSAANACKLPLWPGVSNAYTSAHPVHGTIPACVFALPNLTTLHLSGNRLSGSIVGALCTLFVVVALVPLYLALRSTYATQVHTYAWSVSAGFLSGELPFALLVVFWTLLLVFLSILYITVVRHFALRDQSTAAGSANGDRKNREWVTIRWQKGLVTAVFILVNFVVVVGVNVGYVVVAIGQSSDLLIVVQVLMSFFKLGWNNGCAAFLMQKTVQYVHGVDHDASVRISRISRNAFTALRIGVTLLNTIAIPCGVVAAIAPACFYNVFVSAAVTSSYEYPACSYDFATTDSCREPMPQLSRSTYHPPFAYDYQCSSSLVTYYAPTFVNRCITNTFVTPLLLVAALWLYRRASPATCGGWWARLLRCFVPTIILPIIPTEASVEKTGETVAGSSTSLSLFRPHRLLDGNQLVVTLVGYLGLLLTFGAVFPPLAVAVAVTLAAVTLCARLRVGRFLTTAEALGRADLVAALEQELRGRRAAAVLRHALWMLVTVSCWFYTLFLFDTLGDSVGFERAYWVLIVFPLLPAALYLFSVLFDVLNCTYKTKKEEDSVCASSETACDKGDAVELATLGDTHNILHL